MIQWNLMLIYSRMKNWKKYDSMLDQALKSYEILAQQDARFQDDVADLRDRKLKRRMK